MKSRTRYACRDKCIIRNPLNIIDGNTHRIPSINAIAQWFQYMSLVEEGRSSYHWLFMSSKHQWICPIERYSTESISLIDIQQSYSLCRTNISVTLVLYNCSMSIIYWYHWYQLWEHLLGILSINGISYWWIDHTKVDVRSIYQNDHNLDNIPSVEHMDDITMIMDDVYWLLDGFNHIAVTAIWDDIT
jgi:hypothetical protein